ncbi:MAG: osmotically-inducible protein OsmY [Verrucomicrobiales bacterium]|jgi:osmotically-inducible protein OsmY
MTSITKLTYVCLALCSLQLVHATVWTDDDIGKAIVKRIEWNPAISGNGINVHVQDGIVTLSGTVTNLLESRRAERIAASRRGVRSVNNKVFVEPRDLDEERLATSVKEVFADDPMFHDQAIEVTSKLGVVNLSGEVNYPDLKELSESLVAPVNGVRGIENRIKVRPTKEPRTDQEIQFHIARRFSSDVWLNGFSISAGVVKGNVILIGSAGTLEQLRYAVRKAWAPGVVSIDSTRLRVDPRVKDRSRRYKAQPELNDRAIREAVRDVFGLHSWIRSSKIDLEMQDGVATLRGSMLNLGAKRAARRTANNTVGVKRVNNLLTGCPSTPVDDSIVVDRVTRSLKRNFHTSSYAFDVSADEGVVTLKGQVETLYERTQAASAAATTYGTRQVVNEIRMNLLLRGYDPVALEDIADNTAREATPGNNKPDAEIKEDVESEIFWSWWVDSDAVKVTVKGGKVTLYGTVDCDREMRAAVGNAFDGGADLVVNHLNVGTK